MLEGQRIPPGFSAAAGAVGQNWRDTELPVHLTPAKAGGGTLVHQHGNTEHTTGPSQVLSYACSWPRISSHLCITLCLEVFFSLNICTV